MAAASIGPAAPPPPMQILETPSLLASGGSSFGLKPKEAQQSSCC